MRSIAKVLLSAAVFGIGCAPQKEVVKPVAAIAAPPPKAVEVTPEEILKGAHDKLKAGDLDGAQSGLDAYIAKTPTSASALFERGWVAEQKGQVEGAASFYERALKEDPAHLGAALNLARLRRIQERYSDGQQVIRAALAKREGDPNLLNALAALLRLDKKDDEAEAMVRKVLVRHPTNPDAYKNLALIELDRGLPRLAEIALNNAKKFDDKDRGIPNNLGILALKTGDVVTARARFKEAIALDPNNGPAWANLGSLALQYRDYQTAAEAYAKSSAQDPARWELQLGLAWANEGLKKPAEARAAYEKVLAQKPDHDDALYGRALALKAEGKLPESMEAFKKYTENPMRAKTKDAQGEIAKIDMRLKNPPVVKAPAPEAKKDSKAGADISQLALPGQQTGTGLTPPVIPDSLALPSADDMPAIPPGPGAPGGAVAAPSPTPAAPAPAPATPAVNAPEKSPEPAKKPDSKPADGAKTPEKASDSNKPGEGGKVAAAAAKPGDL